MHITKLTLPTALEAAVRTAPKRPYPADEITAHPWERTADFGTLFACGAHAGRTLLEHLESSTTDGCPIDCFWCSEDGVDATAWYPEGACSEWEGGDCNRCNAYLTPRAALLLAAGAEVTGDEFRDLLLDVEHGELASNDELSDYLPPAVLRYLDRLPEDEAGRWLSRYAATFDIIAARVHTGEVPTPRCTAEEMALHTALDEAETFYETVCEDGYPTFESCPAVDDRDTDIDRLRDLLFEDHDVLMLFDAMFDGIEDPTSDLSQHMRFANLHGKDWFEPFRATDPVGDPGRASLSDPRPAELPQRPTSADVKRAAQTWLDEVVGRGVAATTHRLDDENWCVDVTDLPLTCDFEIVVSCDTGSWTAHGLVWAGDRDNDATVDGVNIYDADHQLHRYWDESLSA